MWIYFFTDTHTHTHTHTHTSIQVLQAGDSSLAQWSLARLVWEAGLRKLQGSS